MSEEFTTYSSNGGPFEVKLLNIDNNNRVSTVDRRGIWKLLPKKIQAIYNEAALASGRVVATHEVSYDYSDAWLRSLFFVIEYSDNTAPENIPVLDPQPTAVEEAKSSQE